MSEHLPYVVLVSCLLGLLRAVWGEKCWRHRRRHCGGCRMRVQDAKPREEEPVHAMPSKYFRDAEQRRKR